MPTGGARAAGRALERCGAAVVMLELGWREQGGAGAAGALAEERGPVAQDPDWIRSEAFCAGTQVIEAGGVRQ